MSRNTKSAGPLQDVTVDVKAKLSALWVALMFFYIYADILLFYRQGHVAGLLAGKAGGMEITQAFVLASALVMAIPSLMVFLSLALKATVNRWANIGVAIFFFIFNLIGLPTYPSAYDKFLIVVGLVFNALTIWYAWNWVY